MILKIVNTFIATIHMRIKLTLQPINMNNMHSERKQVSYDCITDYFCYYCVLYVRQKNIVEEIVNTFDVYFLF